MNVGFIALGKLGFPCAVAAAQRDHRVFGYDVSPHINEAILSGKPSKFSPEPYIDAAFAGVQDSFVLCGSIASVLQACDLVFVSPQTPHPPELDGSIRFDHAREDFNYDFLESCCRQIAKDARPGITVVVVSTVLPGTTERVLSPLFPTNINLIYSPSFIAQSTVVRDYHEPEFALVGTREGSDHSIYRDYLRTIHDAPILHMTIPSAELTKVFYNTFIGFKIMLANTAMQLCHNIPGADCHQVMDAIQIATDRIVSPKYLHPGMGDGGGCHPRDNIAMAFICDKLGLSYNPFDYVMTVREQQTEFIAQQAIAALGGRKHIVVMGLAFKPNVSQRDGSPSLLLLNILREQSGYKAWGYDKYGPTDLPSEPAVYIIAVDDPTYSHFNFRTDDVVIDPWRNLGR